MSKFRGIKAGRKFEILKRTLSFMTVHAEEQGADPTNAENNGGNQSTPQINYEQLIAQARKEEKEKLYPRIKKLEDDNAALVKTGNDNLIKIGDLTQTVNTLTKELESYKKGEKTSEEVEALKTKIATLTEENEKLKKETPNAEEIRKQIEAEYEVKLYLKEQTEANKDLILSSFMSDVQGKTKEEIDASIQSAKDKSLAIKKELGLVDEDGNPVEKTSKKSKKSEGKKPQQSNTEGNSKPPVANPTDGADSISSFDPEYIRNLDPRSEEYKEFRKSLGLY